MGRLAGRGNSGFTVRSLAFGLLGIVLMSGLAGYHDSACRSGPMMIGNHLPGGALAYLMFVGLVWNGLAGRISRRLALAPRELAVVLCATLVACFPPTSGLFRYFLRIVMLPWYYAPGNPDWSRYGLLVNLRRDLFPEPWPGAGVPTPGSADYAAYQAVYQGLFSGLAQGDHWVGLADIPLRAWGRPLLFWGPLVFLLAVSCIALQFVVHRQWAHHEQLGYPLAQVTGSLCARADDRPGIPDVFRTCLFWWGFVPVFVFYVLDLVAATHPTALPRMAEVFPSLKRWELPTSQLIPSLVHVPVWWGLERQGLFFTIVGAAYFVSTEISLTMGVGALLMAAVAIAYYAATGHPVPGGDLAASRAGAYAGYSAILLYTGRSYFAAVFGRALGLRRRGGASDAADATAVLAARVLVVAFLGFVATLRLFGVETVPAFAYALTLLMLFLVFTRIICETGIPYLQTSWGPPSLLVSLVGPAAIGSRSLTLLHWVNVVLAQDPRECLMPYAATGIRVAEEGGVRLGRVFAWIVASVAVALAVAFVASTYTQYNVSAMLDGWASKPAVTGPFNECARMMREMRDLGELDAASGGSFAARLPLVRPVAAHLNAFAVGMLLVVGCSALRFKFSRFPLHPVLFLAWGTQPAMLSWGSFLVGWFVKTLVVRFGGGGVYRRLKPLFVGLICGEVVFVGVHVVFDFLYMAIFGVAPPVGIFVLPG